MFTHLFKKAPVLVLAYMAAHGDMDRLHAAIVAVLDTLKKAVNGKVPTANGHQMSVLVACAFAAQGVASTREEALEGQVTFSDLVPVRSDDVDIDLVETVEGYDGVASTYEAVATGFSVDQAVSLQTSANGGLWQLARARGLCAAATVGWAWPLQQMFMANTVVFAEDGLTQHEADEKASKAFAIREGDRRKAERAEAIRKLGYGFFGEEGEDDPLGELDPDEYPDDNTDLRLPAWMQEDAPDEDSDIDDALSMLEGEFEDEGDEEPEEDNVGYAAYDRWPSKVEMDDAWGRLAGSPYVKARCIGILKGLGPAGSTEFALQATTPFKGVVVAVKKSPRTAMVVFADGSTAYVGTKVAMYAKTIKLPEGKALPQLAAALNKANGNSPEVKAFIAAMFTAPVAVRADC